MYACMVVTVYFSLLIYLTNSGLEKICIAPYRDAVENEVLCYAIVN